MIEYLLKKLNEEIKNTENERLKIMNGFENKKFILFSRHYKLFMLLKEFIKILDDNNIHYHIIGGLLIGLFRHNNSFIPWDDDIDICIFEKDKLKLLNLMTNYNYIINKTTFNMYKFTEKEYKNDSGIFIDIFFITQFNDKYDLVEKAHRNMWPDNFIYHTELFPLKKMDFKLYLPDAKVFDIIKINIPNKSIVFLNRAYKNWQKSYKIDKNHCSLYNIFPSETIHIENFEINYNIPGI